MITLGVIGLLVGYGSAAIGFKVKQEKELNDLRMDVGLPVKPIRVFK